MTHCNTGSLATAGYGTALGVIRSLHVRYFCFNERGLTVGMYVLGLGVMAIPPPIDLSHTYFIYMTKDPIKSKPFTSRRRGGWSGCTAPRRGPTTRGRDSRCVPWGAGACVGVRVTYIVCVFFKKNMMARERKPPRPSQLTHPSNHPPTPNPPNPNDNPPKQINKRSSPGVRAGAGPAARGDARDGLHGLVLDGHQGRYVMRPVQK